MKRIICWLWHRYDRELIVETVNDVTWRLCRFCPTCKLLWGCP